MGIGSEGKRGIVDAARGAAIADAALSVANAAARVDTGSGGQRTDADAGALVEQVVLHRDAMVEACSVHQIAGAVKRGGVFGGALLILRVLSAGRLLPLGIALVVKLLMPSLRVEPRRVHHHRRGLVADGVQPRRVFALHLEADVVVVGVALADGVFEPFADQRIDLRTVAQVARDIGDLDAQLLKHLALVRGHRHLVAVDGDVFEALLVQVNRAVKRALSTAGVPEQRDKLIRRFFVGNFAGLGIDRRRGLHLAQRLLGALLAKLRRRGILFAQVVVLRVEALAGLLVDDQLAVLVDLDALGRRKVLADRVYVERRIGNVAGGVAAAQKWWSIVKVAVSSDGMRVPRVCITTRGRELARHRIGIALTVGDPGKHNRRWIVAG